MTGDVLNWLDGPAAALLLTVLGHFCWQGAAVWAAAVLIGRGLSERSPQVRYRAELAAFAVLCVCPAVTWTMSGADGGGGFVVRGEAHMKPQTVAEAEESPPSLPVKGGGSRAKPEFVSPGPRLGEVVAAPSVPRLSAWLLGLYAAGVCVGGLRLVAGAAGVAALKRSLSPAPDDLRNRAAELASRLGLRRAPRAGFSRRARAPCAAGWVRPAVALPLAWAGRVPPEVLDAALAHELAHLRAGDVWVNLLQRLAETVLFYHPAVWVLSARVRVARELCRDADAARVLGDPAAVARGLEFAASSVPPPYARRVPLFCPSFGEGSMPLLTRVNALLGRPPMRRSPLALTPAALLAVGLPLAWLAGMAWAEPPDGSDEVADAATPAAEPAAEMPETSGAAESPSADWETDFLNRADRSERWQVLGPDSGWGYWFRRTPVAGGFVAVSNVTFPEVIGRLNREERETLAAHFEKSVAAIPPPAEGPDYAVRKLGRDAAALIRGTRENGWGNVDPGNLHTRGPAAPTGHDRFSLRLKTAVDVFRLSLAGDEGRVYWYIWREVDPWLMPEEVKDSAFDVFVRDPLRERAEEPTAADAAFFRRMIGFNEYDRRTAEARAWRPDWAVEQSLAIPVSLDLKDLPLGEALHRLSDAAGGILLLDRPSLADLDVTQLVSIAADDLPLYAALDRLLPPGSGVRARPLRFGSLVLAGPAANLGSGETVSAVYPEPAGSREEAAEMLRRAFSEGDVTVEPVAEGLRVEAPRSLHFAIDAALRSLRNSAPSAGYQDAFRVVRRLRTETLGFNLESPPE